MRSILLIALLSGACGRSDSGDRTDPPVRSTDAAVAARPPADAAPDVATGASMVEPEEGTSVALPEGRALEVRKPLRGRKHADAPVFVARGSDPAAMVRRALDDVAPKIPAGARVLIKVNLGGYDRIKKGPDNGITDRTTSPALVGALIAELRRRGVQDLVVADGPSEGAAERDKALAATGLDKVLADAKVPFADLNHYGDGDTRPASWRIKAPWATHLKDELVLSDELVRPGRTLFLIDVPKIKAHRFAVMSLSIKNLMGAVGIVEPGQTPPPWQRRWRMHRELVAWMKAWRSTKQDDRAVYNKALAAFSERLADLWGIITPDLVILDGLPAVEGDGFQIVRPYGDGILIASANGCFADYIAAEYFGLSDNAALEKEVGTRMPPAIFAVANRYYGGLDALRRITVHGDLDWRTDPQRPVAYFKAMAPFELNK